MLQSQWEQMCASISPLNQNIADTQEENANLREKVRSSFFHFFATVIYHLSDFSIPFLFFSQPKIGRMHQRIEKYQKTLKSFDEERAQVTSEISMYCFCGYMLIRHSLSAVVGGAWVVWHHIRGLKKMVIVGSLCPFTIMLNFILHLTSPLSFK